EPTALVAECSMPLGVKRRAPALLVVPRELQIVTLMRHTALDRSDARPGVQPSAQRLDLHGAPARLTPEAREVQRRQQQASTRIEHWRESTIVPQDRQGARTKPTSSSSRTVMMAESSSLRAENSDPLFL